MTVRAKFYVKSVTATAGGDPDTGSVELQPVSRGAANAEWSRWTPSGQLTMSITNPDAWRFHRDHLGREVYVDITPVPDVMLDPARHTFVQPPDVIRDGEFGSGCCVECGQPEGEHMEHVA